MLFNCCCTLCIPSHKKNIMVIRRCAPCVVRWYPSWVLRWDDDSGKSRIMCLGCECRCLRRMKGLSRSWGWAGCIRDSMEWWGNMVQWNGSLMGGEILRRGWDVVLSWWGAGYLAVLCWVKVKGKVFYGQEPPSGESTTTECGFNYQLLAVIYWSSPMGSS